MADSGTCAMNQRHCPAKTSRSRSATVCGTPMRERSLAKGICFCCNTRRDDAGGEKCVGSRHVLIPLCPCDSVVKSPLSMSPKRAKQQALVQAPDEKTVSKATLKLRLLKKLKCTLKYEKLAWAAGAKLVAGVDEVGRGSLFGPVVAAAVILDPGYRIRGLRDSKLLDRDTREKLAPRIREHALAWAIAAVDVATIDQINIYWASKRAMEDAVCKLTLRPDHLLIDAMRIGFDCAQT